VSNVIAFIERMGQDAQLRHASRNEVEIALANAQIDPELRAAIVGKDQERLEALLGGSNVCCMQFYDDSDERESETCLEQCA
jgi:hypothetical protein